MNKNEFKTMDSVQERASIPFSRPEKVILIALTFPLFMVLAACTYFDLAIHELLGDRTDYNSPQKLRYRALAKEHEASISGLHQKVNANVGPAAHK